MKLLLSMESHELLNESVNNFDKSLDNILNENIGAMLGSPIKFKKIKNNAKKLQKALVQQSLNDLDLKKKMAKTKGERTPEETEVLKSATAAKNQALKDQAAAINLRMDTLSTTDGLKTVATLAKSKAKVAAAETALKNATDSESKILKVRLKKAQQSAADAQATMGDYESTVNDDGVSPEAAKETAPPKPDKEQLDTVKKGIESLEKKIQTLKETIKKRKEADPPQDVTKYEELLGKHEANLKAAKDTLDKASGEAKESNFIATYYSLIEMIEEVEIGLAVLETDLNV